MGEDICHSHFTAAGLMHKDSTMRACYAHASHLNTGDFVSRKALAAGLMRQTLLDITGG